MATQSLLDFTAPSPGRLHPPVPLPKVAPPVAAPPAPTPGNDLSAVSQLVSSLQQLVGNAVSPEKVKAIVAEEIRPVIDGLDETIALAIEQALSEIPPTVLEVRQEGKEPIRVTDAHDSLPSVIQWLAAGENVWLAGPAGSGKTTIGRHAAEALGLEFAAVSCTAGMSEAWLLGSINPHTGQFERGPFTRAFEDGQLFLVDEIDAADSNVLMVLNACLDSGFLAVPRRTNAPVAKRHPNFRCIASANTFGHGATRQYCGRNQIDAATLDRFVQVAIGYSPRIDALACPDDTLRAALDAGRAKVETEKLRRILSPRSYRRAHKALVMGLNPLAAITPDWTTEEREKVFPAAIIRSFEPSKES